MKLLAAALAAALVPAVPTGPADPARPGRPAAAPGVRRASGCGPPGAGTGAAARVRPGVHARERNDLTPAEVAAAELGLNRILRRLGRAEVERRTGKADPQRQTARSAGRAGQYAGALATWITVPVYFHVIHDGSTGNVPDGMVRRQIAVLNASYGGRYGGADTRVRFALRRIDRSDNGGWYYEPERYERTYKPRLHRGGRNTLNLYSVHIDGDLLGWSTFPWKYRGDPKMDGVTIHSRSMPGGPIANFDRGFSATHEVGHWLGLYHTFQDGCGGEGDRVADTPPEREPANGCPQGKDTCAASGRDPVHNFMDYSYDTCMTSFTADQSARMRKVWAAYRG